MKIGEKFVENGQTLQDICIVGQELRKEVREDGLRFDNLYQYLRKYHGFDYFEGVEIGKVGDEIRVRIRHIKGE